MAHADNIGQREHAGVPESEPASRQTLSKQQRLTHCSDIREAYAQGRRTVGSFMVLWTRSGLGAQLRLGVVASRKVGNAVERARAKRLLREVYRRNRFALSGNVDVVLVARHAILRAEWNSLTEEFLRLAANARLITKRETTH